MNKFFSVFYAYIEIFENTVKERWEGIYSL